jgi:peptidylprolyl isomerase
MKLASTLLILASSASLVAQSKPATPAKRPAGTAATRPLGGNGGCAKLPDLSPKIPALPAGLSCAKPLYTISSVPSVRLDYVSPQENSAALRETLGLEPSSFSLAYIDVKVGPGPLAAPHKWYSVKYTGYLTDGTKFDSSYDHPGAAPFVIEYGQHHVIPGWDTGFDGMHVGGKRRLFIPYQLAYGPNGRPPAIPPSAELIFDIELVAQSDTDPTPPAPPPPAEPAKETPGPPLPPDTKPTQPQ